MSSSLTADQHKLMGNEHFKLKAFDEAIAEYSTAIVCLPSDRDPFQKKVFASESNSFLDV